MTKFNYIEQLKKIFTHKCFRVNFRIFKHIPTVMIPAFWFTQNVELTEELAKEAKVRKIMFQIFQIHRRHFSKLYFVRCLFQFKTHFFNKKTSISIQQIVIQLPSYGLYLAYGISGLSLILLLAGAVLIWRRDSGAYQNLDDELSTDSLTTDSQTN